MKLFNLTAEITAPAERKPAEGFARFTFGSGTPAVKTGDKVKIGTLIAKASIEGAGDLHSSVSGEAAEITASQIVVKVQGAESEKPNHQNPASADEMRRRLSSMGIDTRRFAGAGTLVVNGMNPEPLVTVPQQLMRDFPARIKTGLDAVRKMVSPSRTIFVGMKGTGAAIEGAETKYVKPEYPASLDPLVVKAATGKENPADTAVVSIEELWNIGTIVETGMPFTQRVVTVLGKNMLVDIGTAAGALFSAAGVQPSAGDKVIFGGPMRGECQYTLDASVGKDTRALMHLKKGEFRETTPDQCINCGECTLVCPSRVQASLIGRFVEFGLYEDAKKLDVDYCMECGLCTYVCPAGRPMLQYMQFGKQELRKIEKCLDDAKKKIECDAVAKTCEDVATAKCEKGQADGK